MPIEIRKKNYYISFLIFLVNYPFIIIIYENLQKETHLMTRIYREGPAGPISVSAPWPDGLLLLEQPLALRSSRPPESSLSAPPVLLTFRAPFLG